MNFKKEIAELYTKGTGIIITEDCVHCDNSGWHYIQDLEPGHILILKSYTGRTKVFLAYSDCKKLEHSKMSCVEFFENANINGGFYRGGGTLIRGVYWKPIKDISQVKQYLETFNTKDLKKSVEDKDNRLKLIELISSRLNNELNLNFYDVWRHQDEQDKLIVVPGFDPKTAIALLNRKVLNRCLYFPEEENNFEKLVNDLQIRLGKKFENHTISFPDDLVGMKEKEQFYLNFWQDEMPKEKSGK